MLLGRASEVERIDGRLRAAADARASAALIVHGEPGVGKTTLVEQLATGGFTVLRAHPLESEAHLAFAGLYDIVRPVRHLLPRLPRPQRAALASALALGPPAPGDRFAVGAGTLSLLAAAAEQGPVLAVVDDAHWLDGPSRDALVFAGRRLANEGVVLLLVMREREWVHTAGIDLLELRGLAPEDAGALVDSTGAAVDGEVRGRLVHDTDGNPLAILEAIGMLSEAQLLGAAPITHPLAVGRALEQTFAQHLDGLPASTRSALLIAAASDTGDASEILEALRGLDLGRAALEPAADAGLIVVTADHVRFRHPLIRSAVYHVAEPAETRAAHAALAVSTGGVRSAWHLAAASAEPNEAVARELEAAASSALGRSAYAAAGSAFETAAALSPDDAQRLRRTIGAGRAYWLAGESERSATLLDGVFELATEPTMRADLQLLRLGTMAFARPIVENYRALVGEAERVAPYDRARAAALYASASFVCFPLGDFVRGEDAARRGAALLGTDATEQQLAVSLMIGVAQASNRDIEAGRARLLADLKRLPSVPSSFDPSVLASVFWVLVFIEEWTLADRLLDELLARVRADGSPASLPIPLVMGAELELRRGRVPSAYAAAAESAQLAQDTVQPVASSYALVTLGRTEAILGHEAACRAHATAANEHAVHTGARVFEDYSAATLGLLELTLGRPDRAIGPLTSAAALDDISGKVFPHVVQAASDLVEALELTGAHAEAARVAATFGAHAQAAGLRWPRALAARCRGLVEPEFEPAFAESLALLGDEMPFDRARTLLCLGRRRGRHEHARVPLREALDAFEACGAEPWADQARAALAQAGELRAPRHGSLRELTPQELQVALTVARGASPRDAAARLFLSEATVEVHLAAAQRKLDVDSLAALARRLL